MRWYEEYVPKQTYSPNVRLPKLDQEALSLEKKIQAERRALQKLEASIKAKLFLLGMEDVLTDEDLEQLRCDNTEHPT